MLSEDMELQGIGAAGGAGLAERTDPLGAQRGHTAQRRAGKVPVGPAAATAIAAPKPMAQGGAAAYLDPGTVRSTSSAHGASDRTQVAALGNLATEVSARAGSSPGNHAPFSPCRSAGYAARGAKASRFGAACGHAAGTTRADAAGSHESGAKMNCQCSKCSGGGSGKTPPIGQTFDAVPIQGMRQGADLYHAFNGFEPSRVMKIRHSRVIPPVVVELGELVGLIYRSDKGQPGQPLTYIHRMEDSTAPG